MSITIEDLARDAAEKISSNPSRYILILHNGRFDIMDKIYRLFNQKLGQTSKKYSLVKIKNPDYKMDDILKKKERDGSIIFVFYDAGSKINNKENEIRDKSFIINIGESMR